MCSIWKEKWVPPGEMKNVRGKKTCSCGNIHKEKKKREARGEEGETQKGLGNLPSKKTRKNQKSKFSDIQSQNAQKLRRRRWEKPRTEKPNAREKIRNKRKNMYFFRESFINIEEKVKGDNLKSGKTA